MRADENRAPRGAVRIEFGVDDRVLPHPDLADAPGPHPESARAWLSNVEPSEESGKPDDLEALRARLLRVPDSTPAWQLVDFLERLDL